jgi:hypothetical protein
MKIIIVRIITVLTCSLFFAACNTSVEQSKDLGNGEGTDIAGKTGNNGIALKYPNDTGIEQDPAVLFVEKFDDGMKNIMARYQNIYNESGMTVDSDVPVGSKGPNALVMTNIGGKNTGSHLFKNFHGGFDSTVYIRYYVKYPSVSKGFIHHQGIWLGGYNPATDYPNPRAGICKLGNSRISLAYEPVNGSMGSYIYWGEMQSDPSGNKCWGNDFVNGSHTAQKITWDEWMCVEIMVKLNNPVTAANGELRLWQNGVEVGYWRPGFPKGTMTYGKFTNDESALPFKGFTWRTDPDLKINYIWIEFYDDTTPSGESHHIKFDNVVMATEYIGPIKN